MTGQRTNLKTALYCRLSRDDGSEMESSSIQTQKEMLSRYARENGLYNTEFFIDDGYSGTNFNRPAFQRMISEIEDGKIDTVITKDLSRLGRNYIETGVYIEVYFPEHRVRYIAINDAVDTVTTESADFTPFKNIMNEFYAKDTSRKVKSALKARVMDGMYVATSAPYGYQKLPEDHHRLIVDERYAPVVRGIFKLALDGMGISSIRNEINQKHILRPGAVNPNGYERHFDGVDDEKRYTWSCNSIRGILRNPVYAGHLVMGKRVSASFKSKKRLCVLPEDYTVIRNVHEPIVAPEDFEVVQKLITSRRKSNKQNQFDNIFAGLIKCEDCGYAMTLSKAHRTPREDIIDNYGYMCNNYKSFGKKICTSHWIEARTLYEAVLEDIRKHAQEALTDDTELIERLLKQAGTTKSHVNKATKKILKEKRARLAEVDKLFAKLYEDRISGSISERNYQMMTKKFETEQVELENAIKGLQGKCEEDDLKVDNAENFTRMIKEYAGIDTLNATLLNRLIEKITIGEPKTVNGEQVQEIKIYYKFIGNIY